MRNFDLENVDCHAALAMTEKRWGFPRRTLRALLGMTKSGQSGRSLLPESGADAPAVLSAVYPDSTPAKNRQADVPQYGRSMIEMLGVLAIIGVLSVGGIAGYSKAMQKYRINKTIEQITLIAGNVRAFFAPQRSYKGLNNTILKKAKLVPDEMWDDTAKKFKSVFGYEVNLSTLNKFTSGDEQAFMMNFGLPGDNEEVCIELLTKDWSELGVTALLLGGPIYKFYSGSTVELGTAVAGCSSLIESCKKWHADSYNLFIFFDASTDLNINSHPL